MPNLRALHGYEFKVTYARNREHGDLEALYGKDDQELVNRVQSMGVQQFSVARTNLEDVYLAPSQATTRPSMARQTEVASGAARVPTLYGGRLKLVLDALTILEMRLLAVKREWYW